MSRFTNNTAGQLGLGADAAAHLTSDVSTGMEIVAEGAV